MEKICDCCGNKFIPTKNNLQKRCSKKCMLIKEKERYIKWCLENKVELRKKAIEYGLKNKEHINKRDKKWRDKNKKIINKKNRIKRNIKYYNNNEYRIKTLLRTRLKMRLKYYKVKKLDKTDKLLGCSLNEYRKYLESKFKPGMNWENYGIFGWHEDHIIGLCNFDLTKLEEQKKAFHYSNVQPLWCNENWSKKRYTT